MRLQHYNAAARGDTGNARTADVQALYEDGGDGESPARRGRATRTRDTRGSYRKRNRFNLHVHGDTYCYDCLCNYHNQIEQHKLSLGGAKEILKSLF